MKVYTINSKKQLFEVLNEVTGKIYFQAGGTDLNLQINNNLISDDSTVVNILQIPELSKIYTENDAINIGACSAINNIVNNNLLKQQIPWLCSSLKYFASPLISNLATIGGNIANSSPTADTLPLLLVLDASLELLAEDSIRVVKLSEFFTDYKKNILANNEIIAKIIIKPFNNDDFLKYHKKLGNRSSLTIAKTALAGLINKNKSQISLAASSLSAFAKRLTNCEKYFLNNINKSFSKKEIEENLLLDVTPIDDFRSDSNYRTKATVNMIYEFFNQVK